MTPVICRCASAIYSFDMQDSSSAEPRVLTRSIGSSAGKLAEDLVSRPDRSGDADMSCLAGMGAGRADFLAELRGRDVSVLGGRSIECASGIFEQAGHIPAVTRHIRLHDHPST